MSYSKIGRRKISSDDTNDGAEDIALSGAFGCCVLSFQILLPILFGSALTVSVLVILLLCGESVVAVAFGKRGRVLSINDDELLTVTPCSPGL